MIRQLAKRAATLVEEGFALSERQLVSEAGGEVMRHIERRRKFFPGVHAAYRRILRPPKVSGKGIGNQVP